MSRLWQNSLSKAEKIALSQRIAGATGMDERAVEKDWWVVAVLKALSMTQYAHLMSFKGGTEKSRRESGRTGLPPKPKDRKIYLKSFGAKVLR